MSNLVRTIVISIAIGFSFTMFISLPQIVRADGCDALDASISTYGVSGELPSLPKYCTTGELTRKILNIAFVLIAGISVLFIIIGAYWYMTAGGNEDQVKKGRTTALYALIGLVVVILAVTVVNVVVNFVIYDKLF